MIDDAMLRFVFQKCGFYFLRLLFSMIDTVDFFLLVSMSVVSPTANVEYTLVKQDVAMADDAVLGALSLVLVVMRSGLIPLPIHAFLRQTHSLCSTICFNPVDPDAKLKGPMRARSLIRSMLSEYIVNLFRLGVALGDRRTLRPNSITPSLDRDYSGHHRLSGSARKSSLGCLAKNYTVQVEQIALGAVPCCSFETRTKHNRGQKVFSLTYPMKNNLFLLAVMLS
jgi:hypothetical protein